jgi:hypothetical protein
MYATLHTQFHQNQTEITVVEVKHLRQTIAIEASYGEVNAWLEWIKYSVCTLNIINCYTCGIGKMEPQVVSFPLARPLTCWYCMHGCPLPGKDSLRQLLQDLVTTVSQDK